MQVNKLVSRIIMVIAVVFLAAVPGCWSNYELERRALVVALGVDKGSAGRLLVSAQMVVPSRYVTMQRAPGGGGRGGEKPYFVASAEAPTMAEAARMLAKKAGREVFFSFLEIVVIGKDLAKEGIAPVTEWVNRAREQRLRTLLAVSAGTAKEVVEASGAGLERIPAAYLRSSVLAFLHSSSRVVRSDFFGFLTDVSLPGKEPVAARIIVSKTSGKKQAQVSGSAVFRGYRLAGWLTETETRGYLWITGGIRRGIISASLPGGEEAAFTIRGGRTKIAASFVDGSPVFNIDIKMKANVEETHDLDLALDRPETLEGLETIVEEQISREVQSALAMARELGADIFGLGEVIHRQCPAGWKQICADWENIFPHVPVKVKVKASVRRTETSGNPVRPGKNSAQAVWGRPRRNII